MREQCVFGVYDIENEVIGCFCAPNLVQKDANIVHTDAKLLPKDAKVVPNGTILCRCLPQRFTEERQRISGDGNFELWNPFAADG
jgi:hypothetical protein